MGEPAGGPQAGAAPFPFAWTPGHILNFLINGCILHECSSSSAASVHAQSQDRGLSASQVGKGMGEADAAPYPDSAPFLKATSSGFVVVLFLCIKGLINEIKYCET